MESSGWSFTAWADLNWVISARVDFHFYVAHPKEISKISVTGWLLIPFVDDEVIDGPLP